jgi:hypothetical protein
MCLRFAFLLITRVTTWLAAITRHVDDYANRARLPRTA